MASSGFSLGGLASGLDTKSLIQQLMNIERMPLARLQDRKNSLSTVNSAFQAISTRLSALQGAASDLTLSSNMQAKLATSSNTAVVTASAASTAALGSYQVRVDQLATSAMLSSNVAIGAAGGTNITATIGAANASNLSTPITTNGAGSFTVNGVAINYNTGTDSLSSIMQRINSSNAGVTATYSSTLDRMTLTSKTTGAGSVAIADVTGNFAAATGLTGARAVSTAGQNALIGIVGVNGFTSGTVGTANDVTSTSNTFSNVVGGLSFTAQQVNTGLQTVTVGTDTAGITGKIKAFVDGFNQTMDSINAARAKGGSNAFDRDLAMIQQRLLGMVSNSVSGQAPGAPTTLASLGIGTSRTDPTHLTIDQTKLQAQLTSNPDAVAAVFQTAGTGVGAQFQTYLTGVVGANGVFATRDRANQQALRQLDTQISNMTTLLNGRQANLSRQFTAMEKAVARLHSQQNAFASQLSSLR